MTGAQSSTQVLKQPPSIPQPSFIPVKSDDPYHHTDHTCYNCIQNDYIFCHKTNSTQQIRLAINETAPESVCCKNYFECPQLNDAMWQCSLLYSDKVMALRMCPQKEVYCGNSSEVYFSAVNQSQTLNITLGPGEVCVYDVRAECGVPSFIPEGASSGDLKISTIDFDDNDLEGDVKSNKGQKKLSVHIPKISQVIATSNDLGQEYLSNVHSWKFTSGALSNGTSFQTVQYSPNILEVGFSTGLYQRYSAKSIMIDIDQVMQTDSTRFEVETSPEFRIAFFTGLQKVYLEPVQTLLINPDGSSEVIENGYHYFMKGSTVDSMMSVIDTMNKINQTQWSDGRCNFTEVSNIERTNITVYVSCVNGTNYYSHGEAQEMLSSDSEEYYYNWDSLANTDSYFRATTDQQPYYQKAPVFTTYQTQYQTETTITSDYQESSYYYYQGISSQLKSGQYTWQSSYYDGGISSYYSQWTSSNYNWQSSYEPWSSYESSYQPWSSYQSSYYPWSSYESSYYPWSSYESSYYPWSSYESSYYPWSSYQSSYYPWSSYESSYYPWSSYESSYYPWSSYESSYYPWSSYESSYYPWSSYESSYYPWSSYESSYYPWSSYESSYYPWSSYESSYYPWSSYESSYYPWSSYESSYYPWSSYESSYYPWSSYESSYYPWSSYESSYYPWSSYESSYYPWSSYESSYYPWSSYESSYYPWSSYESSYYPWSSYESSYYPWSSYESSYYPWSSYESSYYPWSSYESSYYPWSSYESSYYPWSSYESSYYPWSSYESSYYPWSSYESSYYPWSSYESSYYPWSSYESSYYPWSSYQSSYYPWSSYESSYYPWSSYESSYYPWSSYESSYYPWSSYESSYYPWSSYESSYYPWSSYESSYYPWSSYQSSYYPWSSYQSSYYPWSSYESSYYPWSSYESSYYPWSSYESSYYPWSSYESSYNPWSSYQSSYYPWSSYQSSYNPWSSYESSYTSSFNPWSSYDDNSSYYYYDSSNYYSYVAKDGAQYQEYDQITGGIKKYKETVQNSMDKAIKGSKDEPMCKGRNQMIVVADQRIPSAIQKNSAIKNKLSQTTSSTQSGSNSESLHHVKLQLKTVELLQDGASANFAMRVAQSVFALLATLIVIYF